MAFKLSMIVGLIFLSATLTLATPVKLTLQPKGTNQIQLTFGSVTPGGWYQVLVRTNGPDGHWITLSSFLAGSNKTFSVTAGLGGVQGLTTESLSNWNFVAGEWNDSEGDELPMIYKELVLRIDPYASGDPYGNPMGDGWNNLQKMQNNMDPYKWYTPPPPSQSSVRFVAGMNGSRKGSAVLAWQIWNGPVPDYFVIERANRTPRPNPNPFPIQQPGQPFNRTNYFAYMERLRQYQQQYRQPFGQRPDPFVTGPYIVIAQVPGQAGVHNYRYVDTNVDTLFQPQYQIQSHYSPPPHVHLDQVNAASIRKTILTVTAQQATNGYTLAAMNPMPYAWYLLLVRDKNDPQWRASGYFASGTNRDPVYLHVDKKGMMSDGQSPISMPKVHFLPDVVEPEFTAGWGEDSDGDGLPDIYEVLVTHTDPDNADTGNTGVLDGYKEMTDDGWSNLEKFRRRVDPLRPAQPPPTVELKQPTGTEIMNALTPKTDLSCELEIEVRTNGATDFQPIEQVPWMLSKITNFRQSKERRNYDLRVSWRFAQPEANQFEYDPLEREGSQFRAIESLLEKTRIQLAEQFKAKLASGPPLSPADVSNNMVSLFHDYRQGGTDKGIAMAEAMALQDNQSQDFYGKVIDQYGQPVGGADVTVHINLTMGNGGTHRTQTDANGFFQFTEIRGESLSITPSKTGYQIDEAHLGLKGLNGPETGPNKREIYTMWKLRGAEPMIHGEITSRKIIPDGRPFTIDFVKSEITEGANGAGDIFVQIQRPAEIKPRQKYDWSFTMTAIGGGFIEVSNDDYLNEAPESGYQPEYVMARYATNVLNYSTWQLYRTDRTFFVKSRDGQVYGHFHIKELEPDYRDMAALQIEFYVNPARSRNLEFDPAKQIR
jgi:hypothetical protein